MNVMGTPGRHTRASTAVHAWRCSTKAGYGVRAEHMHRTARFRAPGGNLQSCFTARRSKSTGCSVLGGLYADTTPSLDTALFTVAATASRVFNRGTTPDRATAAPRPQWQSPSKTNSGADAHTRRTVRTSRGLGSRLAARDFQYPISVLGSTTSPVSIWYGE